MHMIQDKKWATLKINQKQKILKQQNFKLKEMLNNIEFLFSQLKYCQKNKKGNQSNKSKHIDNKIRKETEGSY